MSLKRECTEEQTSGGVRGLLSPLPLIYTDVVSQPR